MSLRRASLAALVLAACTLPPRGGDTIDQSVNVCLADDTCGAGGICRQGLCMATDIAADLPIVFTITRSQISGANNVQPVPVLAPDGKPWSLRALSLKNNETDPSLKLSLPPLATVDVSLVGSANNLSTARSCFPVDDLAGDGETLPMTVTLRPSAAWRGLGLATYGRRASDPLISNALQSLHALLSVPSITYDVYVVPDVVPTCPLPPILMRDLVPTSGRLTTLKVDLKSLQSSKLDASITTSTTFELSGWTARLVDAATGLTISTVVTFARSGPTSWTFGFLDAGGNPVSTPLEFYPQRSLSAAAPSPAPVFLVMTPPDPSTAPRLAWDLAALDVFNQNAVSLDLTSLSLDARVDVELRAERGDGPLGQLATVLLATEATPGSLVGAPAGALAHFSAGPTRTDASGVALFSLLPGNYRALGVASDNPSLDLGDRSFTFLPRADGGTLTGFALPLPKHAPLDVLILPPRGDTPLSSVPFTITPSLVTAPIAERVFGATSIHPRSGYGITEDDGHLRLTGIDRFEQPRPWVDAGLFDIALHLPIDRGFPWLVKPSVTLPLVVDEDTTPTLRVSLPVAVQGPAVDPLVSNELQRPLSGARLQAFASSGGRYVQIAEGLIDQNDTYRLLLPSSL